MLRHMTGFAPLALAASFLLAGCSGPPAEGSNSNASAKPAPTVATPAPARPNAFKPSPPIIKMAELNDWYRSILVDPEATRDPATLEALVRPICEGMTVCRVGVWTDEWSVPSVMPVRAPQLEAQDFAFGRNAQGEESSLWNCNKYPEFAAQNACLPSVLK